MNLHGGRSEGQLMNKNFEESVYYLQNEQTVNLSLFYNKAIKQTTRNQTQIETFCELPVKKRHRPKTQPF